MSVFAVSFNLKWDNEYSERYGSLMTAIRARGVVWEETTSFALVETSESLDDFERRLWLSKFNSTKDILLVIDVAYDSATMRGPIRDKAKLKKLLYGIVEK